MLTPQQIGSLIRNVAEYEHVEVEDDGHHFFAVIVSSMFGGRTHLARHRPTENGLETHLQSNKLHILSISVTTTPAKWAAKQ